MIMENRKISPTDFPLLILSREKDYIARHRSEKKFIIISKSGRNFYEKNKFDVYTSRGELYYSESIESVEKVGFFDTIKYFQQAYKLKLKLVYNKKVNFIDLKDYLLDLLNQNPSLCAGIPYKDFKQSINVSSTFEELINVFDAHL